MTDARLETTAPILQDWTPLAHCLDWQLGQLGWQLAGARTFLAENVPGIDHQGGLHGRAAAEVLFANCAEVEAAGALEAQIECLELGMGSGLGALLLLDRFQALCATGGKDWYERLTLYATDATPRMVADAREQGVFDRHAGRVVLGLCDALDPARVVRADTGETLDLTGRLRLVSHTFLLCVLPANLFARSPAETPDAEPHWSVVLARTVLRHSDELDRFTSLGVERLKQLATAGDAADRLPLAMLQPLLEAEVALAPIELGGFAEGPELVRQADALRVAGAREGDLWVLHPVGAMLCLEQSLSLLRADGALLYADFGPATAARAAQDHVYRRFGSTTAVAVNHFALDAWLAAPGLDGAPRAGLSAPPGEAEAAMKVRLVARAALPATRSRFAEVFEPERLRAIDRALASARGDTEGGMTPWRALLQRDPENWVLLGEAAEVALRRERDAELAHTLLAEVLRINPWYAPAAWNSLGDLQRATGEPLRAREAYEKAVQVHPEFTRAVINLARLLVDLGEVERAAEIAARARVLAEGEEAAVANAVFDRALGQARARRDRIRQWRLQGKGTE